MKNVLFLGLLSLMACQPMQPNPTAFQAQLDLNLPGFGSHQPESVENRTSDLTITQEQTGENDAQNTNSKTSAEKLQGCWDEIRYDGMPIHRIRIRGSKYRFASIMRFGPPTRPRRETHGPPTSDAQIVKVTDHEIYIHDLERREHNPIIYRWSGAHLIMRDLLYERIPDSECLFLHSGHHEIT